MTTSQDEKALLRAIFENPDDDAVRLIYADCIQELGRDAEAERIRDAVAHPNRSTTLYLTVYKKHNPIRWDVYDVTDMMATIEHCMAYARRGFIDEIRIKHDDFMDNFERIFAQFPIRVVRITDRDPYMGGWFCNLSISRGQDFGIDAEIHKAIFQALPMKRNLHPSFEYYEREFDCHEILSQACVALGRHSMGLPMIPSHRRSRQ